MKIDEVVGSDQKAQWGFLKNIVNIDRFFSAGPAAAPAAGAAPPPPDAMFVQLDLTDANRATLDAQATEISTLTAEVQRLTTEEQTTRDSYMAAETAKRTEVMLPY
jgi:hypothetical protein